MTRLKQEKAKGAQSVFSGLISPSVPSRQPIIINSVINIPASDGNLSVEMGRMRGLKWNDDIIALLIDYKSQMSSALGLFWGFFSRDCRMSLCSIASQKWSVWTSVPTSAVPWQWKSVWAVPGVVSRCHHIATDRLSLSLPAESQSPHRRRANENASDWLD